MWILLENGQVSQVDLGANGSEEIEADDSIQIKPVIHCSDFDFEMIGAQIANCQSIDLLGENELSPANAANATNQVLRFHTQIDFH